MTRFVVKPTTEGLPSVYDNETGRFVHTYKRSQKKLARAMADKLNGSA